MQIPNRINIDSNIDIIDISESLNKQMLLSLLSEETPQEKIIREKENKTLESDNVTEGKRRKEAEKNSEKRTIKNEIESQTSFVKEDKQSLLDNSDRKNVLDKKKDKQFLLDSSEKKYKVDKNEDWIEEKEKFLFERKREDKKQDRE